MTLEGLLSTYNKDPQEDLESLFDTIDNVTASLQIAEGVVVTMEVHGKEMRQALTRDVLATDFIDYLVSRYPSERYYVSGRAVALALARKSLFNELSVEDYRSLRANFSEDVVEVFDFEASVERRASISEPSRNRSPSCDGACLT
ncbi:L-Aspartase-like protein [Rhizopogon salebrosus TDB-379]|nr:L-Aspartase-like protein [Rhizopogon salebrosus TDB-379]